MIRFVLAACLLGSGAQAALIDFPTKNRALLAGQPQEFYMYVERDFEGQKTWPWEGGQYGFVRGPQRTPGGVVFATLHEGVDIAPLTRDPAGNPLDDVMAAAAGRVVHVNTEAGASNYGRYIVVEHRIEGFPFYTLYAHLASAAVTVGQPVQQGEILGKLGFTGAGIDRKRAHLHFEIGILLSGNFESWFSARSAGDPNKHGLYNGMNISGTDPAAILLASAKDPAFRLTKYLGSLEPVFKITFPNSPDFSLLKTCPWIFAAGEPANPPAWTVSFTGTGFPIRAVASDSAPQEPRVVWIKDSPASCSLATRGLVGGTTEQPRLTESGKRFAELLTAPPGPPTAVTPQPSKPTVKIRR